jgi:hypothetical protein
MPLMFDMPLDELNSYQGRSHDQMTLMHLGIWR